MCALKKEHWMLFLTSSALFGFGSLFQVKWEGALKAKNGQMESKRAFNAPSWGHTHTHKAYTQQKSESWSSEFFRNLIKAIGGPNDTRFGPGLNRWRALNANFAHTQFVSPNFAQFKSDFFCNFSPLSYAHTKNRKHKVLIYQKLTLLHAIKCPSTHSYLMQA